ncbi:Spy/CpxP family protein refolding chaperone [Zavarzinia compransoris]|uniref:Spy/CpxP family protein refolding chaperone n=1 Tax=Zavarzinia marina TaxID=2911065 RepID=UPI001F1A80E7|nr:Spy/CpxP family protein refolding chaperone [Zavarzinia marina]MCF4164108.1 Spy/CpxP family protein refolding chaperone [Zavarzinia marina]
MKTISKGLAVVLAAGLAAATPAFAQMGGRGGGMGMIGGSCPTMGMMNGGMGPGGMAQGGGPGMGQPGMGQPGMGQSGMGRRGGGMGVMVDARLTYLKGQLAITEAQEPAWAAYAAAVKGRVDTMQGNRAGMMDAMENGNAVERMDVRIAAMEAMLDALKATRDATVALYDALDADQKLLADDLIGNDCGAM